MFTNKELISCCFMAVCNHWTGLVDWTTAGLDYWTDL